jgi:NAD(P)-dependent dehydrogenase (short-subunit alcohol dehydrogenase family)
MSNGSLFRLDGRRALITGPTRGIGLSTARLFAAAGAELVLAGIEAQACEALAQELNGEALPCDVSDCEALERLAEQAGTIDILVCNAGIAGTPGPMHAAPPEERAALFATNLDHPLLLSGLIAPAMAQRGRGSIVLLSSIAGLRGNTALGIYAITKAALAQLARNLAVEWGPCGVRANAIAPGLIATDWADAIVREPATAERRLRQTPLRRIGRVEEGRGDRPIPRQRRGRVHHRTDYRGRRRHIDQ